MPLTLFACRGGRLVLPDRTALLLSRQDGGNLVVHPPRVVWERNELTPAELTTWAALVAAAGWAMLDALPQLAGGCINYWEAGNWALNDHADPKGPKTAPAHRKMHLHLLGRSRTSGDPNWRWGESPRFPDFAARDTWATHFERLTPGECQQIVARTETRLKDYYGLRDEDISPWSACSQCRYPRASVPERPGDRCEECHD